MTYDLMELDELLERLHEADRLYQPGQYWSGYARQVCRAIKSQGMENFRSNRLYEGFIDNAIYPDYLMSYRALRYVLNRVLFPLKRVPRLGRLFHLVDDVEAKIRHLYVNQIALAYFFLKGIESERILDCIEDSCVGNPFFYTSPNGKNYTLDFLNKYDKYLTLREHVDFKEVSSIIELGGGFGSQAEVMLKVNPALRYVIVDIPSQLFVSQTYLSAVFPGKVLPWSETRNVESVNAHLLETVNRQIVPIPTFDLVKLGTECDLIFSDYALMEMEANIVRNYATYLTRLLRKGGYVFIADRLRMESGKGSKSVRQSYTLDMVLDCFIGCEEIARSPYRHFGNVGIPDNQGVNVLLKKVSDR